ncbi:MAG: hypothetical protein H7326_01725 [Bdellovibrionaceae bacterium]|nr:hypothetical protein [Pseudobdellovibrionaceae bacterium]
MRPGRELDTFIAREVLGHVVKVKQKELWEVTEKGERPLRKFSRDITSAWEVVEKMGITIIPIEGNSWFAFVGNGRAWKSPAAFIEFLGQGDFMSSGAAVGEDPAEVICIAASKAIEKKKSQEPAAEC